MHDLPKTIRITNAGWCEKSAAWKFQLGDNNLTVGYAWGPGGVGDKDAYAKGLAIAEKLCAGWNG